MGNLHLQLAIVQVTLLLERAQKTRSLTPDELEFMRSLKAKLLDLSMLQKSRDNQHSRIECIQSGDTNTHFFHIHANFRWKKKFIRETHIDSGHL